MKVFKILSIALALCVAAGCASSKDNKSSPAIANPEKKDFRDPMPPQVVVQNPTKLELLSYPEDHSTVFVLPPAELTATVGKLGFATANIGFCKGLSIDPKDEDVGNLIGASAQIDYKTGWDDGIEQLRKANPSLKFQRAAVYNVRITPEIINGIKAVNPTKAISSLGMSKSKNGVFTIATFPSETYSNNIWLSLYGVCPIIHPEYFGLSANPKMEVSYKVFVVYDYFKPFVKVKIKYNLAKMYQKISVFLSAVKNQSSNFDLWAIAEQKRFFGDALEIILSDSMDNANKELVAKKALRNMLDRIQNYSMLDISNRWEVIGKATADHDLLQQIVLFGKKEIGSDYLKDLDVEIDFAYQRMTTAALSYTK